MHGPKARAQGTGADHLRWLMNAIDAEVCTRPEFDTALLVLTMHDSLIYEVSEVSAKSFARAALEIMRRRPPWADIDFATKVEIGNGSAKWRS
jgi:DNA polymerase I-like protein with 3'-5' exonuclease and polymerase domains